MEKLVILEYSTSTTHIYDIDREDPIDDMYISNLGYNPNDCYWMCGNISIDYHKEVLK